MGLGFNGAAALKRRKLVQTRQRDYDYYPLQWGRRVEAAEAKDDYANTVEIRLLQWGRRVEAAEAS